MIDKALKAALGEKLALGHRLYGNVTPRKPYRDEEDQGGAGSAQLLPHPLLEQQPVGASSDLTNITSEYGELLEAAEERRDEASPELQQRLQKVLGKEKSLTLTHRSAPTLTR